MSSAASNNGNPYPRKQSKTTKSPPKKKLPSVNFPELIDTTDRTVNTIISSMETVSKMEINSLYIMSQRHKMGDDETLINLNTIRTILENLRQILIDYNTNKDELNEESARKVISSAHKSVKIAERASRNIEHTV
jgi:hypothetical protein